MTTEFLQDLLEEPGWHNYLLGRLICEFRLPV